MHEMGLFSVAVGLFVLFPPTSRDFQLDEKEPKNPENPNGQPTCNNCSADFLPPRAGMLSGNIDQQISKETALCSISRKWFHFLRLHSIWRSTFLTSLNMSIILIKLPVIWKFAAIIFYV